MMHLISVGKGSIPRFTHEDTIYSPPEFYFMRNFDIRVDGTDELALSEALFKQEYLAWMGRQSAEEVWISIRAPYTYRVGNVLTWIAMLSLTKLQNGKIIWAVGEDDWEGFDHE